MGLSILHLKGLASQDLVTEELEFASQGWPRVPAGPGDPETVLVPTQRHCRSQHLSDAAVASQRPELCSTPGTLPVLEGSPAGVGSITGRGEGKVAAV